MKKIVGAIIFLLTINTTIAKNNLETTDPITTYIELWKEIDSEVRLGIIKTIWTDKSTYHDPAAFVKGAEELNDMITQFQEKFPNSIMSNDAILINGNSGTFNWKILDANKKLIVKGRDFIALNDEGKILKVIGFFEPQEEAIYSKQVAISVASNYFKYLFITSDFESMAKIIAPNAIYTQAVGLPYGGTYIGFEEWMHMFTKAQPFFDLQIVGEPVYFTGEAAGEVIINFTIKCISKKSGKEITMDIAEHFKIENGLITAINPYYFDTKSFVEVIEN